MKEGWKYKKLGAVADFYRGLTYKREDEVDLSDNCVLRSNNIDLESMSLDFDELKYIRPDFVIPEEKKLKANSVFVCMSNGSKQHVGKVAYVNEDMNYAFGGFMGLIVPKPQTRGKYIYYVCRSSLYRHFLEQIGNGIGITNLRFTDLNDFSIPFPSLSEQQHIVEELDLLSSIIEKKKAQLNELDNLAQSLFYEMFGDPITNEKGWESSTFNKEFEVSSGGTPSTSKKEYWDNGTISWIGSNMCQNKVLSDNDGKYITQEGFEHSSAKWYHKGFVLVALVGATIGKCALLNFDTTTNQNIAGINVPSNKEFEPYFVFFTLQSLYSLFLNIGEGKFKMANLSFVRSLPIIKPPLDMQQQFASKIQAIARQKELIKQSIKEVETLFNSRMDYYFN